ncbi:PqiC family protein [Pseudomonas putida]|uniref:PqiC family protein n=1 Tax=Pseudomonas putida TaxID=303 RepID=UPI00300F1F93
MVPHRFRTSLAWLLLLAAGCSSTPNNYHTLVPAQANRVAGERIQVERVVVPPQVDRPQLVVRQGDSGLAILETEWWGANLVDEFRSALQDLLGGPVGGAPKSVLRVEVQRFDSVPGHAALLDAVWRLQRPGREELTCRTTVQTPAQNSIASLVGAQQANLRKLADAVRASATTDSTRCPAS